LLQFNKSYLKTFFHDKRKTAGGASSFGDNDQAMHVSYGDERLKEREM
jgi:hypothetical protein